MSSFPHFLPTPPSLPSTLLIRLHGESILEGSVLVSPGLRMASPHTDIRPTGGGDWILSMTFLLGGSWGAEIWG